MARPTRSESGARRRRGGVTHPYAPAPVAGDGVDDGLTWTIVRTIGYDGQYDYGRFFHRAACGGVVYLEVHHAASGRVYRRARTSNGRHQFATFLPPQDPGGTGK